MKKISIRIKYTAVFALVLGAAIAISVILNNILLERYYVSNKIDTMLEAYDELTTMIETIEDSSDESTNTVSSDTQITPVPGVSVTFPTQDETEDSELKSLLNRIQEESSISTIVIRDNGDNVTAEGVDQSWILHILNEKQITDYDSDSKMMDKKREEVVLSTDNYKIMKTYDATANTYYLEGWGRFDDGSMFLMRSPLASIKESVDISNTFYIYVGLLVLIGGTLLMYLVMGYITNPLIGLTHLSKKMSELDFEAKYEGKNNDEIGELGMHMNEMSRRLEETIAKLKSANLELQNDIEEKTKLEEMRNEFLGNVSHELKTPIALIQGYAEGLADGVADDPESTKFYCDVIMDEADKMNRMVRKLLSLNQLEFGNEQLTMERFDITAVVSGVVNASQILAQQKEAYIIFDQRTPVYVWGDEYRIEEVVTNYVSNALNHVSGKKNIVIDITQNGKVTRVGVYNTGHNIPEEDLERIWDKFYKVDKAHTREYGGNGIGLSIVKAVMDIHRGRCGVENRTDGVYFWFEMIDQDLP